jgi:hypothetical protein
MGVAVHACLVVGNLAQFFELLLDFRLGVRHRDVVGR